MHNNVASVSKMCFSYEQFLLHSGAAVHEQCVIWPVPSTPVPDDDGSFLSDAEFYIQTKFY
jgi:hypothetical protein